MVAKKRDPNQVIIDATLKLAVDKRWDDITLGDIAAEAGLGLGTLSRHFATKTSIIVRFMAEIDAQLLDGLDKSSEDDAVRDRLFDILMKRFDLLGPYKAALKNIVSGIRRDPAAMMRLACPALRTQHLMMAGAGVSVHGLAGTLRRVGLVGVYGSVFRTWLQDDDSGLARTMAALDRALRRGESLLARTELPLTLGQAVCDFARGWRRARRRKPVGDGPVEQGPDDPMPSGSA